ncbi:MAG: VanZ family protein [candidate division WOR-3 bacterium]
MKKSVNILLLIIWTIVIFVLTGLPGLESPKIKELPIDKLYHFLLFFVYGVFSIRLITGTFYFLFGILVVIAAEVQQLFIPGREFEVLDMIWGTIGLVSVFIIYSLTQKV